jgi:Methyltransferase domain
MAIPEEVNADMLAFWNGKGGQTWVARQEHTDITLTPVTDALLAFAALRADERVVDIGCGCGAPTLEFARAVGPSGRVTGLDISGPMLAEGERRASAAGIANVDWRQPERPTSVPITDTTAIRSTVTETNGAGSAVGSTGSTRPPANRGASTPRITSSLVRAIISGVPNTREATCGRSNIAWFSLSICDSDSRKPGFGCPDQMLV